MPANLSTLPTEILEIIADQTAGTDLPSLRGTCRNLYAAVSPTLITERCFTHRRFILSEHSLKGLIYIAKHSEYGPRIRSLSFGTHRLRPNPGLPEDYQIRENESRAFLKNKSRGFFGTNQAIPLLVEAFRAFKRRGNKISIGIYDDTVRYVDDGKSMRTAYGFDQWFENASKYDSWHYDATKTLTALNSALRAARLPIESLELDISETMSYPLQFSATAGDANIALKEFVCSRTSMEPEVDFQCKVHWYHENTVSELWIKPDGRRLDFRTRWVGLQHQRQAEFKDLSGYGTVGRLVSTRYFRELRLEDCKVEVEVLEEFLLAHAFSLRKIVFCNVGIVRLARFKRARLLRLLKDKFRLEEILFQRVTTSEYSADRSDGRFLNCWSGHGRWEEETQSMLGDMIEAEAEDEGDEEEDEDDEEDDEGTENEYDEDVEDSYDESAESSGDEEGAEGPR